MKIQKSIDTTLQYLDNGGIKMLQTSYTRYKYTPDEMSEDEFLERFVVREDIFNDIFEDIKSSNNSNTNQHYILIGQRGQGKTMLLRKLQIEVKNDKKLSKFLLPVKFAEEQYQIRSLCRLWEEVAEYLQTFYEDDFGSVLDDMEEHFDDENYYLECFSYLESVVKTKGKKLLLLIDNIDELIGKLSDKEQRQLREILISSNIFRIVGGSTKMLEHQHDYSKAFYEYFKIIKLKSLNAKESREFLLSIAKDAQKEQIQKVIENSPVRIETLRRITGGVPRTLVMLFDIFLDEDGNAFDDLLKILDEATPLYKHRMDDLPPALQEIVHTIAINWDGMLTGEIAKKLRMESKLVSAQLKKLEKYEIVESESIGKNKIYKIKERFFNIWYLMRFGRKKDRERVEWLVKFLETSCREKELNDKDKLLDYSITLLQEENFQKSYEIFHLFINKDIINCINIYLSLLISKGQLYQAKKFLEMPEYQLKERFKPIWYALMTLMQDEFPHEIKKMGSELQESVDEVLKEIEVYKEKYTI